MCGICFICSATADDKHKWSYKCRQADDFSQCTSLLHHRGPDASSSCEFCLSGNLTALMQGCVLHLRGELTPQPITNSKGNSLLWNGEVFGGIEVKKHENDTQVLFDLLDSCCCRKSVLEVFQKIDGPWAFIFWQAETKMLWFGRDMFGRRSLLWHIPETAGDTFVLSSVALDGKAYKEIPSIGIFCIDFSHLKNEEIEMPSNDLTLPPIIIYPWLDCRWPGTNLQVQRTPPEDFAEFLYPNSPNCRVKFLISKNSIKRWIPTMCTNPKADGQTLEDYASSSEFEAKCTVDCNSIPKPELDQITPQDAQAEEGKEFEALLGKIWRERKDLQFLVQQCIEKLQEAVNTRVKRREQNKVRTTYPCVETSARVAVLFSGGLDSTILASLADRCLPADEPIDLLNVAFEQTPVVQQPTGKGKRHQRKNKKSAHQVQIRNEAFEASTSCQLSNDIVSSVPLSGHEVFDSKAFPTELDSVQDTSSVTETTFESHDITQYTNSCVSNNKDCHIEDSKSPSISVSNRNCYPNSSLCQTEIPASVSNKTHYSSGLLDTEQCSTSSQSQQKLPIVLSSNSCTAEKLSYIPSSFDPFDVPDRQTGRLALSELNSKRKWNFVEINITQTELQSVRQSHISQLIYPLRTVLDDSIGCAVWFAARGKGVANNFHQESQDFQSQAQVLLCGMAADELFAGYSRHRVTFTKEGWPGLEKEIQEELWRISARNLGRDDRIIADHGKEARFPYLDENFVELVSRIPIDKRVDLHYPRGIGEKLLLRLCAHSLGLVKTACQAKRAIQFGSKIAKLDKKKEKGSDVCDRLL